MTKKSMSIAWRVNGYMKEHGHKPLFGLLNPGDAISIHMEELERNEGQVIRTGGNSQFYLEILGVGFQGSPHLKPGEVAFVNPPKNLEAI